MHKQRPILSFYTEGEPTLIERTHSPLHAKLGFVWGAPLGKFDSGCVIRVERRARHPNGGRATNCRNWPPKAQIRTQDGATGTVSVPRQLVGERYRARGKWSQFRSNFRPNSRALGRRFVPDFGGPHGLQAHFPTPGSTVELGPRRTQSRTAPGLNACFAPLATEHVLRRGMVGRSMWIPLG